jgi:hypothetical protein
MMHLIGNNQTQERDRFPRPRRHLKNRFAAIVERAFEIAHVGILLRVDSWVWEKDFQLPVGYQYLLNQ